MQSPFTNQEWYFKKKLKMKIFNKIWSFRINKKIHAINIDDMSNEYKHPPKPIITTDDKERISAINANLNSHIEYSNTRFKEIREDIKHSQKIILWFVGVGFGLTNIVILIVRLIG